MLSRRLIHKIKALNLPYHVDEADGAFLHTLLCEDSVSTHCREKPLSHCNYEGSLMTFPDLSPSIPFAEGSTISKLVEANSTNYMDKCGTLSLSPPIENYVPTSGPISSHIKTKMKCSSLERVDLKDLCLFYRYKDTIRTAKRNVYFSLHIQK